MGDENEPQKSINQTNENLSDQNGILKSMKEIESYVETLHTDIHADIQEVEKKETTKTIKDLDENEPQKRESINITDENLAHQNEILNLEAKIKSQEDLYNHIKTIVLDHHKSIKE